MPENQSRLEQLDAKIRAFDRLYADQLRHLDDPCVHGVDHAFLDPMRCKECKPSYVLFCNENNMPVGKTVELINYGYSPDPTLWQQIKDQPAVIRRFCILWPILWIILSIATVLLFSACSGGNGGGKYDDYQEEPEAAIESPYDEGTGHDAGFKWAEENGITDPTDCGGDSDSFIEGCQEYADTMAPESDPSEEMPWEDGR